MRLELPFLRLEMLLSEAAIDGDRPETITGLASLKEAQPGDVSFMSHRRYAAELAATQASVVLVPHTFADAPPPGQVYVRVESPSLALTILAEEVARQIQPPPAPGVHPSAVVDAAAEVDPTASIGPLAVVEAGAVVGPRAVIGAQGYLGKGARIGVDTRLHPRVTVLAECAVGDGCILHSGAVIGGDGFGYESSVQGHRKIPQLGNVVLGDYVEIGANSSIDRARMGTTRVGDGTKVDSLVQIGHNCQIGRHCVICGQAGLAGSTNLEDYVVLAGQAATGGHLTVGQGAQIGGQAGVQSDVKAGAKLTGTPAQDAIAERRLNVLVRQLPGLFKRVKQLESVFPDK